MIINGKSRSAWRFWATHLMRTDTNERVSVEEIRGVSGQTVREALREMHAISTGSQTENFLYSANLNPGEGEELTAEQWREAVDRLERNLGLDGHARVVVEHLKDGRVHRHVIWNRIDPDTMTAISDSFDYRRHQATAREIEEAFGLQPVASVTVKDRGTERPERRPDGYENYRTNDAKLKAEAVKAQITALWQEADSGQAFKAAVEESGFILARGDRRDYVLIDAEGKDHSLARRTGVKVAAIRVRMADIDRDGLPSVAEARELARAAGDSSDARDTPQPPQEPPAPPVDEHFQAPTPELTPAIERDLAARFGDWMEAPAGAPQHWREAAPAAAEGEPAPQGVGLGWQEPERGQGADTRLEHTLWERFAHRVRDYAARVAEFFQDEDGPWAQLVQAGRKVIDSDAPWVERIRDAGRSMGRMMRGEAGAGVSPFDAMEDALRALIGGEAPEQPDDEAIPPDSIPETADDGPDTNITPEPDDSPDIE